VLINCVLIFHRRWLSSGVRSVDEQGLKSDPGPQRGGVVDNLCQEARLGVEGCVDCSWQDGAS
jgi:hypothetical protein